MCHSLGGVIVKSATTIALERQGEPFFESISTSIRGYIFFGTPHSGSLSDLSQTLSNIGDLEANVASSSLLNDMKATLVKFAKIACASLSWKILSFYEELPLPKRNNVVREEPPAASAMKVAN